MKFEEYTVEVSGIEVELTGFEQQTRRRVEEEREQLEDFLGELRPSDTFYDVGAQNGLYATLAQEITDDVYAFEPCYESYEALRRNVDNPVKVALGKRPATIRLDVPEDPERIGRTQTGGSGEIVPLHTIDGTELPRPDVLKIDVEGDERAVLEGGFYKLKDCRALYCEVHGHPKRVQPELSHAGLDRSIRITERWEDDYVIVAKSEP